MTSPKFSIVTPCKGRLDFLKRSLPTFVQQPETEVIVVDYDCPDGTRHWVRAHFPGVRVATVNDAPLFNLSRARNIGATEARAPWLVFCDADQLLAPTFASVLSACLQPGTYLRVLRETPWGPKSMGIPLACEAATFRAIGGYDDAFRGWGMEDRELIERLDRAATREVVGPATLVETLTHSNASRSSFYDQPIDVSVVICHYYARIKRRHFETTGRRLSDAQRHSTYGQVERAVVAALADAAGAATFDIRIAGADPPWAARLTAPNIREYHRARVEALSQITL